MHFDREHVYRVRSATDSTVNLALAPELRDGGLQWFDTLRFRVKPGRIVSSDPEQLVFRADSGDEYTFRILTVAEYDAEVRPRVELSPYFASDAELHSFYVRHFL